MWAHVGGETRRTNALDLRETDVSAASALRAVRDPGGWLGCPEPTAVYDVVGVLDGPREVGPAALAAAARSRGYDAPAAARLATVRAALAEPLPAVRGLRAARKRLAVASADIDVRRERVERLGGKVAALRAAGEMDDGVRDAHARAIAALTDAETERFAAAETYERRREEARAVRDERERRLRLADEERRLEREAAAALAAAIRPSYERAQRAVPEGPWRDVLALARVARVRAPLVVAGGPFERAARAAACLDAPVVLVTGGMPARV
ncbi:hypothetical protein J2752_001088 [Halarchaeum rubridurum]|uniref:Uncharacterized protein n=1 Tax=Halarchaeum rubridurum TaxID=489911 RepID=A0A830FX94_9EURY|nr:hypothetical protein [Halarchaeum rubridurum]MBP1954207.1 hypothetical protein [Halarchaeum rubridurum]GGM58164.1 hypothetical protein GCM10009017_05410 [Halarchaeum rubridurum]